MKALQWQGPRRARHSRRGSVPAFRVSTAASITLAVCLALSSGNAWGEWFADLYLGGAFTERADVTIKSEDVNLPSFQNVRADLEDVKFDDFVTFGLRVGRWFERVPDVGLGIDIYHFGPDIGRQTVLSSASAELTGEIFDAPIKIGAGVRGETTIPDLDIPSTIGVSSLDVMLRRRVLRSPDFPHGRLQPYLSAGPAILFTDAKPKVTVGVKVGAGLAWQLHENLALFGEYRFTHFSPEVDTGGVRIGPIETGDLEVETQINTHHVLTGISIRF